MDAIALLCTLHADGPATLKRLRARGLCRLDDLRSLEAEPLAELLGSTPAGARRFLREAGNLASRLGEASVSETAVETAQPPAPYRPTSAVPAPELGNDGLTARERGLIDRVLARWDDRDPGPAAAPPLGDPAPERRPEMPPAPLPAPTSASTAAPIPGPAGDPALVAGSVDGLDPETCAQLRAAGVDTLHDLAALEDRDLIRLAEAGLPYTRAGRLRFLARRLVRSTTPVRAVQSASVPIPIPPLAEPAPAPPRTSTTPAHERFSARELPDGAPREAPALADDFELLPQPPRPRSARALATQESPLDEQDGPAGPFA